MDFTSLPATILDDLYEEPAKLEVLTFDDFLNLPLNDLYIKENGNDPASFAKYKPKDTKIQTQEDSPTQKDTSICLYCSSANVKSCKYCSYKYNPESPVFTPEELERLSNKKS